MTYWAAVAAKKTTTFINYLVVKKKVESGEEIRTLEAREEREKCLYGLTPSHHSPHLHHFTLNTSYCKLYTAHFLLHTLHCTLLTWWDDHTLLSSHDEMTTHSCHPMMRWPYAHVIVWQDDHTLMSSHDEMTIHYCHRIIFLISQNINIVFFNRSSKMLPYRRSRNRWNFECQFMAHF